MIYKVLGKLAPTLGQFIVFSTSGEFALVRSDTDIEGYLEKYPESMLQDLYQDPLYRQPCKDCEL